MSQTHILGISEALCSAENMYIQYIHRHRGWGKRCEEGDKQVASSDEEFSYRFSCNGYGLDFSLSVFPGNAQS